jgi:hypothetical protein
MDNRAGNRRPIHETVNQESTITTQRRFPRHSEVTIAVCDPNLANG